MMGGGFGGCTLSLVKAASSGDFMRSVGEEYQKTTGKTAVFYPVSVSDGMKTERLL